MLGVIKALSDVANYIKELKTYYGLKNQVLFSGHWTSSATTQTIANISKYNIIKVYPWDGYDGITLSKISNTAFSGEGMIQGVSSVGIHTSVGIRLNYDSRNTVSIARWNGLHHNPSSTHSAILPLEIVKIVGVDPIIPQTLTKLGGGIDSVRRWLYAISKTMFDGYCKFCKIYQNKFKRQTKQKVGKSQRGRNNILPSIQLFRDRYSNKLRRCSYPHDSPHSLVDIDNTDVVCGDLQQRINISLHHDNVYNSIQTTYGVYSYTYSLRQIVPRGCYCA